MITSEQAAFLETNHSAAMITVGEDGIAKVARVAVAVLDGKILSSGTRDRVRTRRLGRDPRCTLFVGDAEFRWVALETAVTILDGPEVPDLTVALFRVMQDRPTGTLAWFGAELDEETFRRQLVDEGRILFEFDVSHAYGVV
jgi:uncharacterized pyridoxamine 5'-phosphate oxidase family protein